MFNGRSPIGMWRPAGAMRQPFGSCVTPRPRRPGRRGGGAASWATVTNPVVATVRRMAVTQNMTKVRRMDRDDMSNVLRTCCADCHGLQSLHYADSSTVDGLRCRARPWRRRKRRPCTNAASGRWCGGRLAEAAEAADDRQRDAHHRASGRRAWWRAGDAQLADRARASRCSR